MFQTHSLGYTTEGRSLLSDIEVGFGEGRVHGLVGHNGSGKTTLLRLLARQQRPSAGRILLDGRPLDGWSRRAFAREVAYLPQQVPAAADLTARELIGFGRYPWHGLLGRYTASDRRHVDRAIELTGVENLADRLVETLSGGERQRVWVAMLLAQGSRFLLLDEPLAALDIAHQVEVLELVRRLCRELDLGVVVVLHDINMAARYCDGLVALHSGRLLAAGAPRDLMLDSTLEAIYGIPMHVMHHPSAGHRLAVVN